MSEGYADGLVRKSRRRRVRSSSKGATSASSSLPEMVGDDEYEDEDLNARVEDIAAAMNSTPKPEATTQEEEDDEVASFNVDIDKASSASSTAQDRLKEIRESDPRDPVAYEQKLKVVNRLLMRGIAVDNIAQQLGVSTRTVVKYRSEIRKRMKEEAGKIDANTFIGDSVSFYQEVIAMSLRIASMNDKPIQARIAAMRTAVASKNDLATFLDKTGVLDQLSYVKKEEGGSTELETLVNMTMSIIDDVEGSGQLDGLPSVEEIESMDDEDISIMGI